MAFTNDELEYIVNPALDRIGSNANISLTNQTGREYSTCNRYYSKIRDWLLRSFEWNFAQKRTTLYPVQTLTLDTSPGPDAWAVGDTITGISSGISFDIVAVTSNIEYEVTGFDGDLTDGETFTNADIYFVTYEGYYVYYTNTDSEAEETLYWYDDSDADQMVCGTGYPETADAAPLFEWDLQYEMPSDFIRLVRVFEDSGLAGEEYRFRIEGNKILTNFDTMNIRYVFRETDPTHFTELFRDVLILRLAMALYQPLAGTKSQAAKEEIAAEMKELMLHARVVDAQENNTTGNDYLLSQYTTPQT